MNLYFYGLENLPKGFSDKNLIIGICLYAIVGKLAIRLLLGETLCVNRTY